MLEKLTKRFMFQVLAANASDVTVETEDGVITIFAPDIEEFCNREIELLDKRAAKAKERSETIKNQNDALYENLALCLSNDFEPIGDIVSRSDEPDVTIAKAVSRLKKLAEDGIAERGEILIKPVNGGRSRKIVAYRRKT